MLSIFYCKCDTKFQMALFLNFQQSLFQSSFLQFICSILQVLQLYQITQIHHGLMMVGPSGSGKSMAWRVLIKALERLEGVEGVSHVIDPKVSRNCSVIIFW